MRIVVCIPSLNEADSIGYVVAQADLGLARAYPDTTRTIVNVDSDSDDDTVRRFTEVATIAHKEAFVLRGEPRGKGRNLLRALEYANRTEADCIVILDSDTTTITSEWAATLAAPVVAGRACFVAPVYARSRFEGSTTNHLAWPLVYGCCGVDLRQPIAGDFAIDSALLKAILATQPPELATGYGIDMFLSTMACRSGRPIEQVTLGRKLHKPSFPKIERIFVEEAAVGLELVRDAPRPRGWGRVVRPVSLLEGGSYAHREQARILGVEARERCRVMASVYADWVPSWGARNFDLAGGLGPTAWTDLLAGAVRAIRRYPSLTGDTVARQLLPAFLLRAVTFWDDSDGITASAAESNLEIQAELFLQAMTVAGL
jgi:hypothetical protein